MLLDDPEIRKITIRDHDYEATFLPDHGMNLISYKRGNIEIIDQATREQFNEKYGGLGPMIGPHFYRRIPQLLPHISPDLFPHVAKMPTDPFSHGIGRYAPWKFQATENKISAVLTGKDEWHGVPLMALEGQNFKMTYDAELSQKGLQINLTVVSDTDSIVGIHFYYSLPKGTGTVTADVSHKYYDGIQLKEIPPEWNYEHHMLNWELGENADYAFHPFKNPLSGDILLDAGEYRLRTIYNTKCQENAWQLYHPKGATFVCIEPVTSQNPRRPNLTASAIKILLEIL